MTTMQRLTSFDPGLRRRFALAAVLATATLLATTADARAQVAAQYTYLPASNITRANPPPGEAAELAMGIFDIGGEAPLYVRESKTSFTVLSAGLAFRHHSLDLRQPAGEDEYFPTSLYGLDGSLSFIKSIGPKWYGVGFGTVGLHTDFDNVDAGHLVFEGGGFAVRRFGDLHLGIGPVFTYAFGEPLLLPAPFVRYQGTGKLSFEMKFPRYLKARYAVTDYLELGVAGRSLYNNYRLGDDRAMDSQGRSTVVVFSDLTASVEASVRVYRPIWLTVGVGTTLKRTFTVNDDDGNELFDRGMDNGLVMSASLETRL